MLIAINYSEYIWLTLCSSHKDESGVAVKPDTLAKYALWYIDSCEQYKCTWLRLQIAFNVNLYKCTQIHNDDIKNTNRHEPSNRHEPKKTQA